MSSCSITGLSATGLDGSTMRTQGRMIARACTVFCACLCGGVVLCRAGEQSPSLDARSFATHRDRCSEELQEPCESVASSSTLDMSLDDEDTPLRMSSHDTLRFFLPFHVAAVVSEGTGPAPAPADEADASAVEAGPAPAPADEADDSAAEACEESRRGGGRKAWDGEGQKSASRLQATLIASEPRTCSAILSHDCARLLQPRIAATTRATLSRGKLPVFVFTVESCS